MKLSIFVTDGTKRKRKPKAKKTKATKPKKATASKNKARREYWVKRKAMEKKQATQSDTTNTTNNKGE